MAKIFKQLTRIFSSSNFMDMGDEMIREIQKTQNIDTGLILMKFLSKSKDKDIFEIKCDFVYNSGGKPYIIEEFESTYINIVDLPKYIGEIMSCENETNSLKISEEDIERLNPLFKDEKDYAELAKELFDITAPGGLCILSTNHSGYRKEAFIEEISALGRSHSGHFQMIQSFGLPNDFPTSADSESQYLKVLVFYRNN